MRQQVYCWGNNSVGQLGLAPNEKSPFASAIAGLPPIAGVAFSGAHACALTLSGEVYCWGMNDSKQAGDGTSNAPDGTCLVYPDRPELGSVPCQPNPHASRAFLTPSMWRSRRSRVVPCSRTER